MKPELGKLYWMNDSVSFPSHPDITARTPVIVIGIDGIIISTIIGDQKYTFDIWAFEDLVEEMI